MNIFNIKHTFTKFTIGCCLLSAAFAQEALKSTEEEYYDFLSIQGLAERPTLNYRTLSDSEWKLTGEAADGNHVWADNNLGTRFILWQAANPSNNWFVRGIDQSITMKVYGPEWFNSFNTAAPYGQNDGALWQGRGYNTSLTGGIRFEAYGFEATFKPQLSFSQNMAFDIMPSAYDSEYGYFWGYSKNVGVDAPQRFGNKPFFTYDWGDTEIRWSWHTFTVGFGTQSIWLGPAYLNPILHSNNAATYPKLDIGLRRTSIIIPGIDLNAGEIEARMWGGYLTESQYFDSISENDHNMIMGFIITYAPSFLPGFSIGFTKITLSKWGIENWKYLNPFYNSNQSEDQKISFLFEYLFPTIGLSIWGEIGIDDYQRNYSIFQYLTGHFWHSMTYSVGLKKNIKINNILQGEILFEWNNTEMSQDFQLQWAYNFGFHHQITQGYTNKGQWLGSGVGYGGNSQFLAFKLYYKRGSSLIFFHHCNPDNNYIFSQAIEAEATEDKLEQQFFSWFKGYSTIAICQNIFLTQNLLASFSNKLTYIVNPLYNKSKKRYESMFNFSLTISLKYNF